MYQKPISSIVKILLFAVLMASLSEGYNIPLGWGRRDMPGCLGVLGNRDLYDDVSRICSDCQNVFRDKNVESKCRSDCFSTSYFETCIMALDLAEKISDYKLHASILKEGKK
ncbi:UNVERIFIED_CONTAM: hypothetical protein RMT77_011386 [Armadillidium vulgare]